MVFIAYASGNIAGPQLYIAGETPAYRTGMLASLICFAIAFFLCVLLRYVSLGGDVIHLVLNRFAHRFHYVRANARKDRILAERGETIADATFEDLTDVEAG